MKLPLIKDTFFEELGRRLTGTSKMEDWSRQDMLGVSIKPMSKDRLTIKDLVNSVKEEDVENPNSMDALQARYEQAMRDLEEGEQIVDVNCLLSEGLIERG